MNRKEEPGYRLLVRDDPSRRRGVWARESKSSLELCSGREGDDAYLKLEVGKPLGEGDLLALVSLLECGRAPDIDYQEDDKD